MLSGMLSTYKTQYDLTVAIESKKWITLWSSYGTWKNEEKEVFMLLMQSSLCVVALRFDSERLIDKCILH